MRKIVFVVLLTAAIAAAAQSGAKSADAARLHSSTVILSQIMDAPDKAIPDSIMDGAKCLAIVPSMLNASFIFGANYGRGVATCRTQNGWSAPVFFRVEGGSFGFQAGGQASDLVLVIRTMDGMQHLLQSKFKLGADASAAAGPVGRNAQAATDLTMRAQILTYSRARGLFAGVSVNGAVVHQDNTATQAFYGKDWTFYSLLNGEVPVPNEAQDFIRTVEQYAPTPRATKAAVAAAPSATPPTVAVAADAAPAATSTASPAAPPAADTTPAAAPTAESDSGAEAKPTASPAPTASAPAASATASPGSTQSASVNPTGNHN